MEVGIAVWLETQLVYIGETYMSLSMVSNGGSDFGLTIVDP